MAKVIEVRPTKIEFIRLRRRLLLATRIERIIKDRLSILMLEFLQIVREASQVRKKMLCEFSVAYKTISIAAGYHGYLALDKDMASSSRNIELVTGSRNIAGTRVVSFELKEPAGEITGYTPFDTSSTVDETAAQFKNCLETMVSLAELQSTLDMLGREIKRTKRIVNAIEYNIIPKLEETIHFLNMKFEERDREEKLRLKRVKTVIEAKRS